MLLASWTYVVLARYHLQRIASVIDKVPENQRAELLGREYSTFPKLGLSAEQWLRSQRQRLVFFAVLALLIAVALLIGIAIVEGSRRDVVSIKPVDWQMFLYSREMEAFDGKQKLCYIYLMTRRSAYSQASDW
jgi:hypothetical protein